MKKCPTELILHFSKHTHSSIHVLNIFRFCFCAVCCAYTNISDGKHQDFSSSAVFTLCKAT